MKSISKPTSARSQRPARANVALSNAERKSRDRAFDDAADQRVDAIEDIDLDDFDYDSIDDADSTSGDWLADHDLALEIARRALH